jgi:hypothetical protein
MKLPEMPALRTLAAQKSASRDPSEPLDDPGRHLYPSRPDARKP